MAFGNLLSDAADLKIPNIINYLQGSWKIQYKAGDLKSDNSLLGKISRAKQKLDNVVAKINGISEDMNSEEWKDIEFDSFISMSEVNEAPITNNPIELGSFRSVNKITRPKRINVTIAKGGMGYGIQDLINELGDKVPKARIETIGAGLTEKWNKVKQGVNSVIEKTNKVMGKLGFNSKIGTLEIDKFTLPMQFRIITPFHMISSLNLVKVDYSLMKESGRNMVIFDLSFEEIRSPKEIKKAKKVNNPTDSEKENAGQMTLQG